MAISIDSETGAILKQNPKLPPRSEEYIKRMLTHQTSTNSRQIGLQTVAKSPSIDFPSFSSDYFLPTYSYMPPNFDVGAFFGDTDTDSNKNSWLNNSIEQWYPKVLKFLQDYECDDSEI